MSYTISGKLLRDYQKKILEPIFNGDKKHLFLVMPRRSGKSTMTFYTSNRYINKYYKETNKPCNCKIFAPKAAQAREIYVDNILSDGRKLINISNSKFIQSRLTCEYPFGSQIKFSGSDVIDNSMGGGANVVVLDEYALGKDTAYDRVMPIIRETNGMMIICSTPRGKNHFYDLYLDVKNDKDWHVVKEDVFSLGLMTKEEYTSINMSENLKAQDYLTSWDSPYDGAVYEAPNYDNTYIFNPNKKLYASIDIGQSDACAVGFAQFNGDDINFIYSFELINTSLENISKIIKQYLEKISCNLSNFELFAPHDVEVRDTWSGVSRMQNLRNYGFNVTRVLKTGIMDGIEYVRTIWHNIKFNEKDNFQCIENIKKYVTNKYTNMPEHRFSHSPDMVRYMSIGYKSIKGATIYQTYQKYERRI